MKTTLDLPDELMREMKIRAATHGRKLKDVVEETIRRGLAPGDDPLSNRKPFITNHPTLGFPMVLGQPDAPVTRMSAEEILKLEQDALAADDLARAGITL